METYRRNILDEVNKIIVYGAWLFTFINLINSLFLPSKFEIPGDNILFLFGFLHLMLVFFKHPRFRMICIAFGLYFLLMLVSSYLNGRLNNGTILIAAQILKWPVIMATIVFHDIRFLIRNLDFIIDLIFLVLVGLNLFLILNFFGWGQSLQNAYSSKEYTNFIYYNEPGTYRLAGSFTNPNDNGLIFGLFSIYYLLWRGRSMWFFTILALIMVLLTQSRTCLIALIVPLIIWLYTYLKVWSKRKMLFAILSILMVFTVLVYFSTNLRSVLMGTAFSSNSFTIRYENLMIFAKDNFNHWYGIGIIENTIATFGIYIDSAVVALLLQTGYIGLVLWLFIWISLAIVKIGGNKKALIASIGFMILCSFTNYTLFNGMALGSLAFMLGAVMRNRNKILPISKPKAE